MKMEKKKELEGFIATDSISGGKRVNSLHKKSITFKGNYSWKIGLA